MNIGNLDDLGSMFAEARNSGALESTTQPRADLLKEGREVIGPATASGGGRLEALGRTFTSTDLTVALGAFPKPPNGVAILGIRQQVRY